VAPAEAGTVLIRRRLYDDVDGPNRLPFRVLTGPMASGSAVIKDPSIWPLLKTAGVRKIAAVEMEAATVATVARESQVPRWLVVKGVMDHADINKDDRYKTFAARASAEVLFALLVRLLPDAMATAGTRRSPAIGGRPNQPDAAAQPAPGPGGGVGFTGRIRLEVCRRLDNWTDVADLFEVPAYVRARFRPGHEPGELWDYLHNRNRLGELPGALDAVGRTDLADLLRGTGS
jgi:hypothetical protein